MANDAAAPPARVVVRKLVFTVVGVGLFAASLTILFLGMRAVMDIGGACASGGPYMPRQECPDGTWLIPVVVVTGLIGTGLVVAGSFSGGPQLWVLAWPALFVALGWNFLEYGVDPPPPETGLVWGWLVCAVAFLAMGGIPLVLVIAKARSLLWGAGGRPAPAPGPRTDRDPRRAPRAPVEHGGDPGDADDLVSDLERLAALHRSGALSDEEFARAKAARFAEESP